MPKAAAAKTTSRLPTQIGDAGPAAAAHRREVMEVPDLDAPTRSFDRQPRTVRVARVTDPIRIMWRSNGPVTSRHVVAAHRLRGDWEKSCGSLPSPISRLGQGGGGGDPGYGPTRAQLDALDRFRQASEAAYQVEPAAAAVLWLVLESTTAAETSKKFDVRKGWLPQAAARVLEALADHYRLASTASEEAFRSICG